MAVAGAAADIVGISMHVVPLMVIITAIVFVHELGHLAAARALALPVKTFSVGFGRAITGFTDRHGTRWQIGAIPLGGYINFASGHATDGAPATGFYASPVWKRALVVVAGPLANIVFALLIYGGLYMLTGDREPAARIGSVAANSPAASAGLAQSDLILAIDGREVTTFRQAQRMIEANAGRALALTLVRDGRTIDARVTPTLDEPKAEPRVSQNLGRIGITSFIAPVIGTIEPNLPAEAAGLKVGDRVLAVDGASIATYDDLVAIIWRSAGTPLRLALTRGGMPMELVVTPILSHRIDDKGNRMARGRIGISAERPAPRPMSLSQIVGRSAQETAAVTRLTITALVGFVSSRSSSEQMAGPIQMAEATAEVASLGIEPFLIWMAMLSINLGIFNLLPIPVLDGGHLVLYALEAVRRKPLSERMHVIGTRLGLAVLLALMVVVNIADVIRFGRRFL